MSTRQNPSADRLEAPWPSPPAQTWFTFTASRLFAVLLTAAGTEHITAMRGLRKGANLSTIIMNYKLVFRSRREFPTTDNELRLIATLAHTGEISKPKKGKSTPAATGTLTTL